MQRVSVNVCRTKVNTWKSFFRRASTNMLQISEEVQEALYTHRPVMALESTIITHGIPYPHNLTTALSVEAVARQHGVVPATVGILEGKIKVGLSKSEITYLSDPATPSVKTSRRDFPVVLSKKLNGGTTVSGTMIAAHMAGIPIFVTGGIGGVHRGVEETLDISADLTELGRTPVTVVSAGVKSILDVKRTIEYLETQGVCVTTFGASKDFPAFFVPSGGIRAPYNVLDAEQAASLIDSHIQLGLQSGILVAVPIPKEHASAGSTIESAIQTAIQEAREKQISGKEVTPYILQQVNEITGGLSLKSNIALVQNNAAVGSQIAVELSKKRKQQKQSGNQAAKGINRKRIQGETNLQNTKNDGQVDDKNPDVVVIGGSIVDFYASIHANEFMSNGATYPGNVDQSFGGVGRNLADCMTRLNVNTRFVSAIGQDSHTLGFHTHCKHMDLSGVALLEGHRTATYCAVLQNHGGLMFGIGDMDIHGHISPQYIDHFTGDISKSKLVCIDGNITPEAIAHACKICHTHGVPVWYEPTDIHKATKPFQKHVEDLIWLTSPNLNELRAMYNCMLVSADKEQTVSFNADEMSIDSIIEDCVHMAKVVVTKIPVVMVTVGKHGVILCQRIVEDDQTVDGAIITRDGRYMTVDWFPATVKGREPRNIVSVSGAGDCLAATMIASIVQGHDLHNSLKSGLLAAQLSLQSHHAVPPTISVNSVQWEDEFDGSFQAKRIINIE